MRGMGRWFRLGGALAALILTGAACTEDPDHPGSAGGAGGSDGGTGGSGGQGGAGGGDCAPIPDASPEWVRDYQDEQVARLTGALELTPGTTLTDRATEANRALVRDYLTAELAAIGYDPQLHVYATGTNVWAQLDATEDSNQYLVLGAHYDSWTDCPGANDNATGVALTLAVARYLSDLDCRSMNVMFVLFDEEELGQIGSYEYADGLAVSSFDVVAVHTIDQLGWDSDGDLAIELERPDLDLFDQYQEAVTSGGFTVPLVETSTGGTDHVAFRAHGFAAVGVTEGYATGDTTPHYHQSGDTYDTIDFDYLASTTALVSFLFAHQIGPPETTR
jgi:hypothetical protein